MGLNASVCKQSRSRSIFNISLPRGLFEVDAQAECDRYLGKQKVGLLENGPMEMHHVIQALAAKVLTLCFCSSFEVGCIGVHLFGPKEETESTVVLATSGERKEGMGFRVKCEKTM